MEYYDSDLHMAPLMRLIAVEILAQYGKTALRIYADFKHTMAHTHNLSRYYVYKITR